MKLLTDEYVCVMFVAGNDVVLYQLPSPYDTIHEVGELVDVSLKDTVSGANPEVTFAVNDAVGNGLLYVPYSLISSRSITVLSPVALQLNRYYEKACELLLNVKFVSVLAVHDVCPLS